MPQLPNTPTGAHERLLIRSIHPATFNLHVSIVSYDFKAGNFTGYFDVQPDKTPAIKFTLTDTTDGPTVYVDDTYGLTWVVVSGGH